MPSLRRRRQRSGGSREQDHLPEEFEFGAPITGWLTRRPSSLSEDEHQRLKTVLDTCPELAIAPQLVRDLGDMLTRQTGVLLPSWIDKTLTANLPGLTGFARALTCRAVGGAGGGCRVRRGWCRRCRAQSRSGE